MNLPALFDHFPWPLVLLDQHGRISYGNRAVSLLWQENSHSDSLLAAEKALEEINSDLQELAQTDNPLPSLIPLPNLLAGRRFQAWAQVLSTENQQLLVYLLEEPAFSQVDSKSTIFQLQSFAAGIAPALNSAPEDGDLPARVHLLQTLLDALPDPLFFKDCDGRYIGCNKALTQALGLGREELVGKQVFDVAPQERAALCHSKDQEVFTSLQPTSYATSMQFKDGGTHHVVFRKAPFFLADGSLGGLVAVIHDISLLSETRAHLRKAEERFRTLYHEFPDAVVTIDPLTTRPIDFNPLFPDLLGYDDHEEFVTSLPALKLFAEDAGTLTDHLNRILVEGHNEFEIRLRSRRGQLLDILVKARAIEVEGKTVPYLVLRDMTAQKEAEVALRRSREFAECRFRQHFP